jgi:Skp family chaperone for outer membrane proteins
VDISRALPAALLLAAAGLLAVVPSVARAQDWFIPGQGRQAAPPSQRSAPAGRARAVPRSAPAPIGQVPMPPPIMPPAGEEARQAPQVPLPPIPQLPALPKGAAPPAAVIGVLGVPEVMHDSTAAQQVEKAIGQRRDKLNQDAQKEQAAWRDMQQALANDRGKLSAEQIRTRERELQERITNAQRVFRERNRIIQDAAQYSLAQIERTLIAVIRQVAESRGMNLVLHRAQVALNVNEFDITQQVTEQLNKVLAGVTIPPEGQEPTAANTGQLPPKGAAAQAATAPAPAQATPAPAPAATAAPEKTPPAAEQAPAPHRK